jgi:acyl-coenzyme A thioesterase PaaI-like protein
MPYFGRTTGDRSGVTDAEAVANRTTWGPGRSRDLSGWVSANRARTPQDVLREALIAVQNAVVGTAAPDAVLQKTTQLLAEVADQLAPYTLEAVPSPDWADVLRTERTSTFAPDFGHQILNSDNYRGEVTFGSFYVGANGVAHGGAVALLFDAVLGTLASQGRPAARTADLKVDFRAVTPLWRPVQFNAWIERLEGRKRFLAASLHDDDQLLAEASGLFIELRVGQR